MNYDPRQHPLCKSRPSEAEAVYSGRDERGNPKFKNIWEIVAQCIVSINEHDGVCYKLLNKWLSVAGHEVNERRDLLTGCKHGIENAIRNTHTLAVEGAIETYNKQKNMYRTQLLNFFNSYSIELAKYNQEIISNKAIEIIKSDKNLATAFVVTLNTFEEETFNEFTASLNSQSIDLLKKIDIVGLERIINTSPKN